MNIQDAIVYDIEVFPNVFTLNVHSLFGDWSSTWEISQFRDDRQSLFEFLFWCHKNQIPMIGFNIVHYDYPVLHFIYHNPSCTFAQIFEKSKSIIHSSDRFAHVIWDRDMFAPQVDLFKIHHFDNVAKSTSLKALQINMRSKNVIDMPLVVETILTEQEINHVLIPYNDHDTKETKKFTHYSMQAIEFRINLIPQLGREVINYNDTKIGEKLLELRIGENVCYDRSTGRKRKRQTVRSQIALNEIIFPYVSFQNPEFRRVYDYMRSQILTPSDLENSDGPAKIVTKGVFAGLKASVGGVDYHFGTGGIHGSVKNQRITATDEWLIRDIDVASLYPSLAIQNGLYPEHMGQRFTEEYANLPKERKEWQAKKGKKCPEANSLKLAANGTYGKTNSPYSVFYDPKMTMTITINGQLMLAMLAEWLISVPTLKVIQANTDGITYYIHRDHEPTAAHYCKEWEKLTRLVLEDVDYSRMFIADVNSYIAEDMDGELKLKGRYWFPDPLDHFNSISTQQPPAWHKDLGNIVSTRAAVYEMVYGVPAQQFIYSHTDPFDFMLRYKTKKSDKLYIGGEQVQNTMRYYMSKTGGPMVKIAPARGPVGAYKKANGVSDREYQAVMQETGGAWDARVCTKNKSKYEPVETKIQTGYTVSDCSDADDFNWSNLDREWYVNEARKLII